MTTYDQKALSVLEGKTILVNSALDQHNPPTGVRGTIRIASETAQTPLRIEVELTYPDMFLRGAHDRVIVLTHEEVEQLLSREYCGAYELTVPYSLSEDV